MAWIGTANRILEGSEGSSATLISSERLHCGFLSILYLLGRMSPRADWLRWIVGQMKKIGQEGLVDGRILAESLGALPVFEVCNNLDMPSLLDRYPSPVGRCLSIVLPDPKTEGYIASYWQLEFTRTIHSAGHDSRYHLIGNVCWRPEVDNARRKPAISLYSPNEDVKVPLDQEWLRRQEIGNLWSSQSSPPRVLFRCCSCCSPKRRTALTR